MTRPTFCNHKGDIEELEELKKTDEHGYAYLWCDGVYPKAGLREDKTAFLVVMGANENGVKELLALVEGYPAAAGPTAGPRSCAI